MTRTSVEKIQTAVSFSVPGKSVTKSTPQSMAYVNDNNILITCGDINPTRFVRFRLSSPKAYSCIKSNTYAYHASGSTYCHKNGLLYVSDSGKIKVLDPVTLKLKFSIKMSAGCTGIAYDRITNQFFTSQRNIIKVYPFSALSRGGTVSSKSIIRKIKPKAKSYQDICAYNGIVMVCTSRGGTGHNETTYLDCYDSTTGRLVHSYSFLGELESVDIDNNNYLYAMAVGPRRLIKAKNRFSLRGTGGIALPKTGSVPPNIASYTNAQEPISVNYAQKIVEKAMSYTGQGGTIFWKYGGLATGQPWCACFVWCIFDMVGASEFCYPKGCYLVDSCISYFNNNPDKFIKIYSSGYGSVDNAAPGDFICYDWDNNKRANHIGIVKEVTSSNIKTVEGNTTNGKVAERSRSKSEVFCIYRAVGLSSGYVSGASTGVFASPDRLYSSDNYTYVFEDDSTESSSTGSFTYKQAIASYKTLLQSLSSSQSTATVVTDTPSNNKLLTISADELSTDKLKKTKVEGEEFGPSLPVALDPVEAPFVELTIGGYTFGTCKGSKYPNYIKGLNVVRTNGSMNQYTINIIHQITFGSNPNFIDELISKNGYEKITIKYGDANSNIIFTDSNALLISVNVAFDFVGCNISYTLKATSSAISIASHKQSFPSTYDKPSNIIRNLLYNDSNNDLLEAFPKMRDKNFVERNNLIPNNDTVVSIEEFKDINVISYLKNLVSMMENVADSVYPSNYMLTIDNGYFSINQISTKYVYDSLMYEVNINYPDDNQVFSFDIDTNYSWPLNYNYSNGISNYNYDIGNNGSIETYSTTSSNLLDFSSPQQVNVNKNWWKQVTEFPITASLTCRGLLSPLLLLTYIKVNCIYFGNERLTSGVYIVTGQMDSLDGSGYKTTLYLTRVAGSKQHLTVDGRVKT